MIRNNSFGLLQINSETCLVPMRQALADRLEIVTLNDDGRKIWDLLACETTVTEIVEKLMADSLTGERSVDSLTATVTDFLRILRSKDMLIEKSLPEESFNKFSAPQTCVKIGSALICIKSHFDIISPSLYDFVVPSNDTLRYNQFVSFDFGFKKPSENGNVIARNNYTTIMELSDKYILLYHEFSQIKEVHISKDYRYVSVYATGIPGETLKSEFSLALRDCVLALLKEQGYLMLHSASVLYKDRLYCFSAPSGTGKSTHTNLWSKLCDTPVINGDLNLLKATDHGVIAYGTPWCGTSKIYSTESYPLGGIIFLKRSTANAASKLDADAALPQLIARLTTPYYNQADFDKICDAAQSLACAAKFYALSCTADADSVETIKAIL